MERELIAACQGLLRDGLPSDLPRQLRHERDFIPLCMDVEEDVAAVALLRWWSGPPGYVRSGPPLPRPLCDVWKFHRVAEEWIPLGGGGGLIPEYPLVERPLSTALGGHLQYVGGGARRVDHLFPAEDRHVNYARLRAAAEVARVQIGSRELAVPFHGNMVIAWSAHHPPSADALAADGSVLSSITLAENPRFSE